MVYLTFLQRCSYSRLFAWSLPLMTVMSFSFAGDAFQLAAAPDIGLHIQRVNECKSTRKNADEYCECIVSQSENIDGNDPILDLFLSSSDKQFADKKYEDIIYGNIFN